MSTTSTTTRSFLLALLASVLAPVAALRPSAFGGVRRLLGGTSTAASRVAPPMTRSLAQSATVYMVTLPSVAQMLPSWRRKRDNPVPSRDVRQLKQPHNKLIVGPATKHLGPLHDRVRQSRTVANSINRKLKQKMTSVVEWIDHTSLEARAHSPPILDQHLRRLQPDKPRKRRVSNFDLDFDSSFHDIDDMSLVPHDMFLTPHDVLAPP